MRIIESVRAGKFPAAAVTSVHNNSCRPHPQTSASPCPRLSLGLSCLTLSNKSVISCWGLASSPLPNIHA